MRLSVPLLAAIMVVALITSAAAQPTVVPRYTVIPVTMQTGISSATSFIGQGFTAVCSGNCGGFPPGTAFVGTITDVVRPTRGNPGQIGVRFDRVVLPDGTQLTISGRLTSLDARSVYTDPNTGRLIAQPQSRSHRSRFIAYGAGAGLLIGAIAGNTLEGALAGALAGYVAGALQGHAGYTDVNVPAGTQFGVMLTRPVNLAAVTPSYGQGYYGGYGTGPGYYGTTPGYYGTTPGYYGTGAGYYGTNPEYYGRGPTGYTLTFPQSQPFVTPNNVVMVPFRTVMTGIGQPFTFDATTGNIVADTPRGRMVHQVGTNVTYIGGVPVRLSAPSSYINGSLYVPADLVSLMTGGRQVTWQPGTGTLTIR